MKDLPGIGIATLRRLAVLSSSDPRSVAKVMRGLSVRGLAAERIRAVLKQEKIKVAAPTGVA